MKNKNIYCTFQKCEKSAYCRQKCKTHYELWRRNSNPETMRKHREKSKRYRLANLYKWRGQHAYEMRKSRRTKIGYIRHKYIQMQSRVRGRKDRSDDSWRGKPICSRKDFLLWSLRNPSFHRLFTQWLKNQNDAKLWPSIDRIESSKGYTIGNIRWVTHSENSRY